MVRGLGLELVCTRWKLGTLCVGDCRGRVGGGTLRGSVFDKAKSERKVEGKSSTSG